MDEATRLIKERDAVLKVIEQQEAKILIELNGGRIGNKVIVGISNQIEEEAESEWIKDLDITNFIKLFMRYHESLFILGKEKLQVYKDYMDRILGTPEIAEHIEEEARPTIETDVEMLPRTAPVIGVFSDQARQEFIDEVKRRVLELEMTKKYNHGKIDGKLRLKVYNLLRKTDPAYAEKKAIVDKLMKNLLSDDQNEETTEEYEQEVSEDEE